MLLTTSSLSLLSVLTSVKGTSILISILNLDALINRFSFPSSIKLRENLATTTKLPDTCLNTGTSLLSLLNIFVNS